MSFSKMQRLTQTLIYSLAFIISHFNPSQKQDFEFQHQPLSLIFNTQKHQRFGLTKQNSYFILSRKSVVNFINILRTNFFVRMLFLQLFLCTCNQRKAAEMTFVQKICTLNVGEIDTRRGSATPTFYKQHFRKKVFSRFSCQ